MNWLEKTASMATMRPTCRRDESTGKLEGDSVDHMCVDSPLCVSHGQEKLRGHDACCDFMPVLKMTLHVHLGSCISISKKVAILLTLTQIRTLFKLAFSLMFTVALKT